MLTSGVSFLTDSHDAPGQAEGLRQADAGHALEAPGRADAQGGPARRRPHQGLHQLVAAPLQEARQQKLPKHLPALVHAPSLQHPVSRALPLQVAPCLIVVSFFFLLFILQAQRIGGRNQKLFHGGCFRAAGLQILPVS